MRNIAILKNCSKIEKNVILTAVEKDDNVMFFESENQLFGNVNFAKGY